MDPREQIKAKLDIVPFIAEHIPLKQLGRNFKALCPFHGEKTPSFVVSPERGIWHCFGCNKGGDVFTFLMEFEKVDFVEALRTLAKRTGVKLQQFTPSKTEQHKERLLEINHLASEFYHYLLTSHKVGEKALDYLTKRGIYKKTIDSFKLGYAAPKWELLFDYLAKKKSFLPAEIEEAGLVIPTKNKGLRTQNQYYDRFRNRVMFTLRDHRGNVVGFAGRLLDPDVKEAHSTGSVQAKYVNTPETPLYHKGELLFGLDMVKDAIKKEDQAIVVEGEFDMMQSFQAGVANVVALKGTALTEMQAKLLRRFTQHIALSFDVDFAGDAAARRGIGIADRQGLNIRVIRIQGGKDPDEFIRKSGDLEWKRAIKEAVSIYDFLIDSAISRFAANTPEGKKAVADEVLPSIAEINNEVVKAHFVKRLAGELDVSQEAIVRQMEKTVIGVQHFLTPSAIAIPPAKTREEILEEYLLALLLQKGNKDTAQKVQTVLGQHMSRNSLLDRILRQLSQFYEKTATFAIAEFAQHVPGELLPAIDRLYLMDTDSVLPEHVEGEIEAAIGKLKTLFIKKEMEQIAQQVNDREKNGDGGSLKELQKKFRTLSLRLTQQKKKSLRGS